MESIRDEHAGERPRNRRLTSTFARPALLGSLTQWINPPVGVVDEPRQRQDERRRRNRQVQQLFVQGGELADGELARDANGAAAQGAHDRTAFTRRRPAASFGNTAANGFALRSPNAGQSRGASSVKPFGARRRRRP